jgi:hypothetical protein
VILITTEYNALSGTIPTEIGQLTVLQYLFAGKYDGCLRCFHALFFIYTHIFCPLFSVNRSQFTNNTMHCHLFSYFPFFVILITGVADTAFSGTIPTEIGQLTELVGLRLCKYEGCLRCFHALCFIYKLTTGSAVSSILFVEQLLTN